MKMNFKFVFSLFLSFFFISSVFGAYVYNDQGDFRVEVNSLKRTVYNDEIDVSFEIDLKNMMNAGQEIEVQIPKQSGWDINADKTMFDLDSNEDGSLTLSLIANSNFDYSPSVVSPDVVQISQKEDYTGYFQFPVLIMGENENVSLKFEVLIEKREELPVNFITKFSEDKLSPVKPLRYTISGENIKETESVNIEVKLGNLILDDFSDEFTSSASYKIYQTEIPADISPGTYDVVLTIEQPMEDGQSHNWEKEDVFEVVAYEKLVSDEVYRKGFFKESYLVSVSNEGNIDSIFEKEVELGFLSSLFFGSDLEYESTDNGVVFKIDVSKGETKEFEYYNNYLALYIILIVLAVITSYIYYRKSSNPLEVETKLYQINTVEHEGVKSLKVRIGFENIKEAEIEVLKMVFRMPSYLSIKDGSFLLTEPNHVLKGKNQFKLIWDFKNFEKNDTRIIGFQMVNHKGVLGDIRLPDLEIEVKIDGKIRRYYKSFPIVRG